MKPAEYVSTTGASDLYERTSSQIVMESTADPIAQQKAYAADGTAAPPRAAPAKIVSVVESHIEMLRRM